jgi:D-alanyl-D-alanine carboxypeptidase
MPGITVREVLGHTAGLPDYAGEASYHEAVSSRPGQPNATGTSLAELLGTTVFRQAGMVSTYYPAPGSGMTEDGYDTLWAGPAGAAWSTARDLDLFLTVLLDGALVSDASLAAMKSANPVRAHPPWQQPGYGLGLMVDHGLRTVGHGGGGRGYESAAFASAERGRPAVFLMRSPARVGAVELALRWLTAPDS